jgi:hypothetical protein
MRKQALLVFAFTALATLALASSAAAFGIKAFDVTYEKAGGGAATAAGSHPFAMTTKIEFATKLKGKEVLQDGAPKNLTFQLPTGLVGDRSAVPRCSNADFLLVNVEHPASACPDDAAVGVLKVRTPGETTGGDQTPAFNLAPPPGAAAKIGFVLLHVPVTLLIRVNPKAPHNLIASLANISNAEPIGGSEVTIWGVPGDAAHDTERGECLSHGGSCSVSPGLEKRPFLTLPRACTGPLPSEVAATSWEEPQAPPVLAQSESSLTTTECGALGFAPTIASQPSTTAAESPSGLNFDLSVDDPGLTEPAGLADSDIEKVVVALPTGITTNPAVASGLSACSFAQYESESVESLPGTGCPESSKVGNVSVETPLLEEEVGNPPVKQKEVLPGAIYVAKQGDNPAHNLLSVYMVIKDPSLGVLIGAVGKVEPDPLTGQLTTTFDELPQFPFSRFHLHFREGPKAPLITPALCGKYTTAAALYPYTDPATPRFEAASFEINAGANGAGCATAPAQLPNAPSFTAGTTSPLAGAFAPFVLKLNREDGSQQLASISTTLPQGLLAKLAGVPYCSEAEIAQAASRSGEGQGALELASPSCPAASEVGTVDVGTGAGPEPFHVTGHAYLAGPYKGAPLSLEIITPAIAGPFDLGVVAVRTALQVDPSTAQATAVSDPLPRILHGLPLVIRSITVNLNRPSFTFNPTSCEPKAITGSATSVLGQVAPLSTYFQATSCAKLGFKPALKLSLKGGTRRADHPALHAVLTYPKGSYANIAKAKVLLPPTEFIDATHISNPCTRVQFNENACPKKSVLGTATAYTPLLDKPLTGPIYFRSNGGERELPDVVADLGGQIHVTLVGFIDSVQQKGAESSRLRTNFATVPDAPVSKFVFNLKGGKEGLLVNSTNLCKASDHASVKLVGQNGKGLDSNPVVGNSCGGKKKGSKKGKARR